MRRLSCFFLLLLLCFSAGSCRASQEAPRFLFRFFDVGQGDALLLQTDGGCVLIDAGPEDAQELLCLRLQQLGIRELDALILTHADEDHAGGADGVLTSVPTREVLVNGAPMENESAERMLRAAEQTGTPVRTVRVGEVLQVGDAVLSVLAPIQETVGKGNEESIVLRVQCGEISALLTGDAATEQENLLLQRYAPAVLDCDLYKVGHHGSGTSSGQLFLQSISPTYAVISCGAGNRYGHPVGGVLARLEQAGATVLRTDLLGEIVLESDGTDLRYTE